MENKSYKELSEMAKQNGINPVGKSTKVLMDLLSDKQSGSNDIKLESKKEENEIGQAFEFTLRNKQVLQGKLVKEYPYKGITYLQIQDARGKKHLINPKNAKQI